jgi:hypothetical protein
LPDKVELQTNEWFKLFSIIFFYNAFVVGVGVVVVCTLVGTAFSVWLALVLMVCFVFWRLEVNTVSFVELMSLGVEMK